MIATSTRDMKCRPRPSAIRSERNRHHIDRRRRFGVDGREFARTSHRRAEEFPDHVSAARERCRTYGVVTLLRHGDSIVAWRRADSLMKQPNRRLEMMKAKKNVTVRSLVL